MLFPRVLYSHTQPDPQPQPPPGTRARFKPTTRNTINGPHCRAESIQSHVCLTTGAEFHLDHNPGGTSPAELCPISLSLALRWPCCLKLSRRVQRARRARSGPFCRQSDYMWYLRGRRKCLGEVADPQPHLLGCLTRRLLLHLALGRCAISVSAKCAATSSCSDVGASQPQARVVRWKCLPWCGCRPRPAAP